MRENLDFSDRDEVIIYKLGRIEALLTELQISTAANQVAQNATNVDVSKRLSSLERTRAYGLGLSTAISAVIAIAFNFIGRFIHP